MFHWMTKTLNGLSALHRNVLTMVVGSSVSKVVAFLAYPVIARLYTPDDFGTLSLFTSIIFILLPLATLRLTEAIPIPKSDDEAIQILITALLWTFPFCVIFYFLILIFGTALFTVLNIPQILSHLELLALTLLGAALYEAQVNWNIRRNDFKVIATGEILRSISSVSIQLWAGLSGLLSVGLIYSELAHKLIGSAYLASRSKGFSFKKHIPRNVNMGNIFIKYRHFPFYKVPSDLLAVFIAKLPIFFFAYAYDVKTSGQYAFAVIVFSVPFRLISRNISKAYYGEIAGLYRDKSAEIFTQSRELFLKLVGISALIFVSLLFAPYLFKVIFGSQWLTSGEFLRIIMPALLLEFILNPFLSLFVITQNQNQLLFLNALRFTLLLVSFMISLKLGLSATTTLLAITVIGIFVQILCGMSIIKLVKE